MGLHTNTVLKNSCIKVPVNPNNKLPSASYERKKYKDPDNHKTYLNQPSKDDSKMLSFKDFYKSIPDYKDVTHLSNREFYSKLQSLKENKNRLLLNNDDSTLPITNSIHLKRSCETSPLGNEKCGSLSKIADSRSYNKYDNVIEKYIDHKNVLELDTDSFVSNDNQVKDTSKLSNSDKIKFNDNVQRKNSRTSIKSQDKICSPTYLESWINESASKYDFEHYDDNNKFLSNFENDNFSKKSYSVPSSPYKKMYSPIPLSVSRRDIDSKIMNKLKDYSKELEAKIYKKDKSKMFRAHPVPIESRIPLFDKIMEDQELRRAMTKLQSKAELQAQMKPFSFTEREEKFGTGSRFLGCHRLCRSNPQLASFSSSDDTLLARKKNFKAKPVPKNLFSNYVYAKMREDDFYRALNRRIRAEEMLKTASLPPSMAKREQDCHSSTCRRYHNGDLSHVNDEIRKKPKRKSKVRQKYAQDEYIEDKTEDNIMDNYNYCNNKKNNYENDLRRIYGSNSSDTITPSSGYATRPRSDLDMSSINKSNLASVLRIESSKKKLESEMLKQLEEERFQSEMKWRDSVLRQKPAWRSLKYSHADDLAMRLQMRRDEERLRREQFLHEMELMYGRVHCQPMMFERSYSPRKNSEMQSNIKYADILEQNVSKPRSALSKNSLTSNITSPNRSRKVSINETAETIRDDIDNYSYKDDDDTNSKSSDEIPENIKIYESNK